MVSQLADARRSHRVQGMRMRHLTVRLPTLAENLALDEALLDRVQVSGDLFRTWEIETPAVVLGRASKRVEEVQEDYCERQGIPIVRRCSGGASVVVMSGCLIYSAVLRIEDHPELRVIERVHDHVLSRIRDAFLELDWGVKLEGTSDLTWEGRKFSGNSLRCKRDGVLYHGTLLLHASIETICQCLKMPSRQPDYRRQRTHDQFLTNVPVPLDSLRESLHKVWNCEVEEQEWPQEEVARLVQDRYGLESWNR